MSEIIIKDGVKYYVFIRQDWFDSSSFIVEINRIGLQGMRDYFWSTVITHKDITVGYKSSPYASLISGVGQPLVDRFWKLKAFL